MGNAALILHSSFFLFTVIAKHSPHYLAQRLPQPVHVCRAIKRSGTYAHRSVRECPQRPVDIRRAVQPGTNGDVERLVEDAAQLRGRQSLMAKTQRADALAHVAMAKNLKAADLLQPPPQPFGQL